MNPVNTALWYVERHFASELTLDAVARHAGVSRFHLTRAFGESTGRSLMRYVRGRRLTEAARALSAGAGDILTVALDYGYGSHEAFTRAFREQFGVTPESIREHARLDGLDLVEAIKMDQRTLDDLAPPRIVDGSALLIAGSGERYTCESSAAIPAQWQKFTPSIGHVHGQVGDVAYGVRYNGDEDGNFDYLCGVEVQSFSDLPAQTDRVRIPAHRYAVFRHSDHVSTVRRTHNTIWTDWLPRSGHEAADAPSYERYGPEFDSTTGTGGLEIWLPIK